MGINGLIEFFRLCKVIKNGNTRCEEEPEDLDPDKDKTPGDILDELTGQMKLF